MNFNRILSFIMAVSVLLCAVVSSPSLAQATSHTAVSASADAAGGLIEALGIDVVCDNNEGVTRGEFVYALMQTLKCSVSQLTDLPYEDVSENDFFASSLHYALALRIVSPAERFDGNSPITWQQAAKMMVMALGRDIEASLRGGWPYGYVYVAKSAHLDDGALFEGIDDTINADELCILLKNFLTSYIYQIDGISGENFEYDGSKTVLEAFYGISQTEGIVTCNHHTALYDSNAASAEGFIEIGEITYKYNGESEVGEFVTAYIKEKTSGYASEVIYLDNSASFSFKIYADELADIKNGKIEYYDADGNIKTKSTIQHPSIIYNGKAYSGFDILSVSGRDSWIEAVDNNEDGRIDVIRVYSAQYMYVDSVDTLKGLIIDKNEGVIDLKASNDIKYTIQSGNESADLSAIIPSSVITYYKSHDSKLYHFVTDSDTITGVLSEYDSGENAYIIDGVTYPCTNYFTAHYSNSFTIGAKAALIISPNGAIIALSSIKSSDIAYGYLIDIAPATGLETGLKVKMFTKDDGVATFRINEKTKLNGSHPPSLGAMELALRTYIDERDASIRAHLTASTPKYIFITATSLVRYSADDEGVISQIDTADAVGQLTGDELTDDSLTRYAFPFDSVSGGGSTRHVYSGIYYLKSSKMLHPYFKMDEKAQIFLVNLSDDVDDEKKYSVVDSSYFNTHTHIETAKFIPYDVDETGCLATAVLFTGSIGAGALSDDSPGGVVTSITKAVAPDEEQGIKFTLLSNGEYKSYFVTDVDVLKTMDLDTNGDQVSDIVNEAASFDNPGFSVGDYLRVESDWRSIVTVIGKEFDSDTLTLLKTFENHGGEEIDYYYGPVYAKSNGVISMIPSMLDSFEADRDISKRSRYSFNVSGLVSVYDRATDAVTISSVDEILSYRISGENCHKILIKLDKNEAVEDIVIYK